MTDGTMSKVLSTPSSMLLGNKPFGIAFNSITRVSTPYSCQRLPNVQPLFLRLRSRIHAFTAMSTTVTDKPAGEFAVGVCDVRMPNSVSPSQRVRIFYPTVEDVNAPQAKFFPPSVDSWLVDRSVRSVLRFAQIPLSSVLALPLSYVATQPIPAQATGPVLPTEPKFPVMFFSHGLGGAIGNYSTFCIDMASHGWVIFALEHADGSAFEAVVYNGQPQTAEGQKESQNSYSFIPYLRSEGQSSIPDFRAPQLEKRFEELKTLFDLLASTDDSNSNDFIPLRGSSPVPYNLRSRIDLSRFVIAGHSFGAATAMMYAPRAETTPIAVIALDAWLVPLKGFMKEKATVPRGTHVIFIDMEDSNMAGSINLRKLIHKEDRHDGAVLDAVAVVDGIHNNSSDFALRIPRFIAVATRMTKSTSDPLFILKAQSRAAYHMLLGPQSWAAFTERIRNEREEGLRMAPM